MPDALTALVTAVRAGTGGAASALVERLHPLVARIVQAHVWSGESADDIIQDVWLKVFSRLHQWEERAPFEHWVSRIATTTCVDHVRAKKCRPAILWSDLPPARQEALAEIAPDAPGAASPAADALAHALLQQIIDQLPPADRAIIRWLELEEKSITEVSQLTGWTSGVVRIRSFRARQRLKKAWRAAAGSRH